MSRLIHVKSLPRAILHLDGDAFFVSVETAKNPRLKGKPVVTGGERGIASALSYEAKALGITRGLPIYRVRKNFPQVIILPGDYETYSLYSEKMFEIVRRYSDVVEEYSIDECFADLGGMRRPLKMTYREILEAIKRDIESELNISVSLGLAPTKVLAKTASKSQKPNGLTIVSGKKVHELLQKTPIESVWGIGPNTSQFLKKKGVETAYDFATRDEVWILHHLSKPFHEIWKELNCETVFEIDPRPKSKYASISKTKTFSPPSNNAPFLLSQLSKNLESACEKARFFNYRASRIHFFLKTQGFHYHSAELKLLSPENLPELILPFIQNEMKKVRKLKTLYRATGVTLTDLKPASLKQADLFGEIEKVGKLEDVHRFVDEINQKDGRRSVFLASTLGALGEKSGVKLLLRRSGRKFF